MNKMWDALNDEARKSAAYHEASHTVAAAILELPLRAAGIHVDSNCKGLSCLCCRNPGDLNTAARDGDEREKTIKMLYAGHIAQKLFSDASPADGGKRDDEFAGHLINEMQLSASQRRDKEAALREQARLLVRKHWDAISALAEQLWSKPLGPRVDLGSENGWSDDSVERYMTGNEVRELLLQFQLNLKIE